ncbi:3946_t:CDS:2 [Entrophospora sp. SA101]|nr:3946_t:CDS:2 [Entrophospora sp. SA101]
MKMKKSIWKHEQQTVEIPEDNDTQQNQKQDNELVTIDTEEII